MELNSYLWNKDNRGCRDVLVTRSRGSRGQPFCFFLRFFVWLKWFNLSDIFSCDWGWVHGRHKLPVDYPSTPTAHSHGAPQHISDEIFAPRHLGLHMCMTLLFWANKPPKQVVKLQVQTATPKYHTLFDLVSLFERLRDKHCSSALVLVMVVRGLVPPGTQDQLSWGSL